MAVEVRCHKVQGGHDGSFFDSINLLAVSLEKSGKHGFLVN